MFYSILGKEKCEDSEKISIFTDFNLNVCISYMNNLVKGYDLQNCMRIFQKNLRQQSIGEKSPQICRMRQFSRRLTGMQSRWRGQFLMRKKALTVI